MSLKEVQVDEVIMGCVLQGGQAERGAAAMIMPASRRKPTPIPFNIVCGSG